MSILSTPARRGQCQTVHDVIELYLGSVSCSIMADGPREDERRDLTEASPGPCCSPALIREKGVVQARTNPWRSVA
jgi:hypothetical protein